MRNGKTTSTHIKLFFKILFQLVIAQMHNCVSAKKMNVVSFSVSSLHSLDMDIDKTCSIQGFTIFQHPVNVGK